MTHMKLLLLAAFLVPLSCFAQSRIYDGYVVYDEEMVGFYPCGGGAPLGIDYSGDLDVRSLYQNNKRYLREPLYVEVIGKETQNGLFGLGTVPEPAESYLLIEQVSSIEHHEELRCGAVTLVITDTLKEIEAEP